MTKPLQDAVAHHLWLKAELLRQFPELAEDDPALLDTLEGESTLEQAVIQVMRAIDDDLMMINGLAERMSLLASRRLRIEQRIEKMQGAVLAAMERGGVKKITAPDFTLTVTAGKPKVIITAEELLPADYLDIPEIPAPKPNKVRIAAALKEKRDVPGATLSNPMPHLTVRRA